MVVIQQLTVQPLRFGFPILEILEPSEGFHPKAIVIKQSKLSLRIHEDMGLGEIAEELHPRVEQLERIVSLVVFLVRSNHKPLVIFVCHGVVLRSFGRVGILQEVQAPETEVFDFLEHVGRIIDTRGHDDLGGYSASGCVVESFKILGNDPIHQTTVGKFALKIKGHSDENVVFLLQPQHPTQGVEIEREIGGDVDRRMNLKGSGFLHRPVNDIEVLGERVPRNDRYFPTVEIDVAVEFSMFSNCEQGIPKSGRRDHTLAGNRRPEIAMRTPTVTPKRRTQRNGDCRFFFHTSMIAKTPEGVNTPRVML